MNAGKKAIAIIYHYIFSPAFRKLENWNYHIKKGCLQMCRTGCEDCWAWKCQARSEGQTPYKKFRRGKLPRKYRRIYHEH